MALGGFGQGFSQGLSAGADAATSRAKMLALQQEQMDNKLEYYKTAMDGMIQTIADTRAKTPQDSPDLDRAVQAMAAHVQDTIKGVSNPAFGDKGRILGMAANDALSRAIQTPTMSTAATNELKAKTEAGRTLAIQQTGIDPFTGMAPGAQGSVQPNIPDMQPSGPLGDQTQMAQSAGQQSGVSPAPSPAPTGAPTALAQQTSPEAPAPGGGGLSDSAAAQGAPTQTQVRPLVLNNDGGVLDIGDVPPSDIELMVAQPKKFAQTVAQRYGIDPTDIMNGPQAPGSDPASQAKAILAKATGATESSMDKANADQEAKAYQAARKTYGDAKRLLMANLESRKLLHNGIISGAFAGTQLQVWQALDKIGMLKPEEHAKLDRTQRYIASLANQTAQIIKQFGAGTGLSDADREFARQAAGGDITFTQDALEHILDINSRMAIWTMANPNLAHEDEYMQSLNPSGAQ